MEQFYELWDNEICNICITVLSSLNADAAPPYKRKKGMPRGQPVMGLQVET